VQELTHDIILLRVALMPICVSFRLLQNQIIHDFGVKATLYVMLAYAIVAKNRGGYDFMQITAGFPLTVTLLL
jgi:hypothetical protein